MNAASVPDGVNDRGLLGSWSAFGSRAADAARGAHHGSVGSASPAGSWQIGGDAEVAWIAANPPVGTTIATAIPPRFAAYATVVVPGDDEDKRAADEALLAVLRAREPQQPWWLGYLETGVADLVFPDAPRVVLYWGWPYVLVKAGPEQAASWRRNSQATPWHSALPELMFPVDRSWLVSTLWDDDWRCVGGSSDLIQALLQHPLLDARAVTLEQDATPPGHGEG